MRFPRKNSFLLIALLLLPSFAFAQVVISEVMYNLKTGSDSGREWVEIQNVGGSPVTLATSSWKFFENDTNHGLSLVSGSETIAPGGFAVIASDSQKFRADWPTFSGAIFDSAFSLSNSGETIAIKSSSTTTVDQLTYNVALGGAGDGNSLQKINGVWKASLPTPGLVNDTGGGSASQSQSAGASTTANTNTNTNSESNSSSSNGSSVSTSNNNSNWPVEPQIFSKISAPSTAIAGADVIFKGEAVGLDKKPIVNPRYLWNFGDGGTKEGESVLYAYNLPGDFVVVLDVSSGKLLSTSRVTIKVIGADIAISDVVNGTDGKIELVNNSNQELDLSWWRIESGGHFFSLPKNTKILARGRLPLSAKVLGFSVDDKDLAILYPNGSLSYKYEKKVFAVSLAAVVAVASPGARWAKR